MGNEPAAAILDVTEGDAEREVADAILAVGVGGALLRRDEVLVLGKGLVEKLLLGETLHGQVLDVLEDFEAVQGEALELFEVDVVDGVLEVQEVRGGTGSEGGGGGRGRGRGRGGEGRQKSGVRGS